MKQLDKDTSYCVRVTGTNKMNFVKVLSLSLIETKEYRYSIKARLQQTFKSLGKDTPDSSAVDY